MKKVAEKKEEEEEEEEEAIMKLRNTAEFERRTEVMVAARFDVDSPSIIGYKRFEGNIFECNYWRIPFRSRPLWGPAQDG